MIQSFFTSRKVFLTRSECLIPSISCCFVSFFVTIWNYNPMGLRRRSCAVLWGIFFCFFAFLFSLSFFSVLNTLRRAMYTCRRWLSFGVARARCACLLALFEEFCYFLCPLVYWLSLPVKVFSVYSLSSSQSSFIFCFLSVALLFFSFQKLFCFPHIHFFHLVFLHVDGMEWRNTASRSSTCRPMQLWRSHM